MSERKHSLLVCTVGGSPEPILKSLEHWQPARVLFVPSEQTRTVLESALANGSGFHLSPGCYRICPVPDAEDLGGCLNALRSLDNEVEEWLGRGDDYQVVADVTAGTKCMSVALALQARRWRCQFSYIGGARRTKEGVGVVESGSERVVHSANPWDALGFQAVESFVGLFDQFAFAAATSVVDRAKRNTSESARKRELNALRLMSEAYDAWDRFDHKGAASKLNELEKYDNDLQAILGQTAADQIRRITRQQKDYLRQLLDGQTPSIRHVTDLLANARRRRAEGRIDDAVARLYRAIESLAQVALADRHNIPNTKQVPLGEVPETLRGQWASRAENGSVFLGLQDAYTVLDALCDELGAKFKRLNLHDRERSPLTARNRSILAHGFERVSDQIYEQLWKAVLELANVPETELPSFPKIGT